MKELISVIMAEHNTKKDILKKSIDSILNQSYQKFELIIVNDVTNAENEKYLNYLKNLDNRINIISNNTNLGLAASLNKAINYSKGDYIFRMDTDDIALPFRFETQMEILNKGEDIVTGRALVIDENDNIIGKTKNLPFYNIIKRFMLYYLCDNGVIHPLIAAKRKVFLEHKYDENIKYAQDFELWLRMSKKYKIFFDNSVLLKYRMPPKNINENKVLNQYRTHQKVTEVYVGHNLIKMLGSYYTLKKIEKLVCEKLGISKSILKERIEKSS
ncbi:glycosyltransferase [Peribacillus deserti]|uniref:Glycosyltransferase 2-like domain-containing protein n=1 Tax=Peribacillus deserti TaxID=673318 RepID=A0A2N5MBT1_9BACI|nr:glycosyltransferase [Peribacillus deserti]PLT31793.1 hypothetical protein CUU66_01120 [Peribacillus deserti]